MAMGNYLGFRIFVLKL